MFFFINFITLILLIALNNTLYSLDEVTFGVIVERQ
jgi:hypothetical protein